MAKVWTASASASGDLELVADQPELGTIRHAIRDGRFPLVWCATDTGIWKTADEGVTFLQVKAAPGATMVAYGALVPALQPVALTIVSTPGEERLRTLWNGAGNDAPPPNWYVTGYPDGDWVPSVLVAPGGSLAPLPGTQATGYPDRHDGEQVLLRRHFTVPEGTITTATLTWGVDEAIDEEYLNGHRLPFVPGGSGVLDVKDLLVPGENVLAGLGHDQSGGRVWFSYKLAIA